MNLNKNIIWSSCLAAIVATSCGVQNERTDDVEFIESTTTVSTSEVTTSATTTMTTAVTTSETTTSISETEASETELIVVETEPVTEEIIVGTQPIVVEPVEEYLVYKPSTKYAHRSTCHWNSGDAYRCDNFSELEVRICSECNPEIGEYIEYVEPESEVPSSDGMTYVGEFQATYYTAWSGACGGSGRTLIDCSYGSDVKGSIASSTLYNLYGYYVNDRTTVYIECDSCPSLNGMYYLDDSTASWVTYTIDFYYDSGWNCPFQYTGRLYGLRVYI